MAYKMKPKKAVKARFKVTGTGKLKRRGTFQSHLRSGRSGDMKRRLGRPEVLFEGHAKNMRRFMLIEGTRPKQIEHERKLRDMRQAEADAPAA